MLYTPTPDDTGCKPHLKSHNFGVILKRGSDVTVLHGASISGYSAPRSVIIWLFYMQNWGSMNRTVQYRPISPKLIYASMPPSSSRHPRRVALAAMCVSGHHGVRRSCGCVRVPPTEHWPTCGVAITAYATERG